MKRKGAEGVNRRKGFGGKRASRILNEGMETGIMEGRVNAGRKMKIRD